MRALLFFCLAALLWVPAASAGTLSVRVVGADGKPQADMVIALRPVDGAAPLPKPDGRYEVSQSDTQFHPFVSVVPVRATVFFPNLDPFRHHVYSFSPAKRFELKLYAKDQTRSVLLDKPGVVALGCNIHDSMTAFIYVTDTLWTARTDARGVALIHDVPARAMTMTLWHPYLVAPANQLSRPLAADAADRKLEISVKLRPPPMMHMSDY